MAKAAISLPLSGLELRTAQANYSILITFQITKEIDSNCDVTNLGGFTYVPPTDVSKNPKENALNAVFTDML